jgi:uncharacterized SAM-binding protein YcdF (DUF218 family)
VALKLSQSGKRRALRRWASSGLLLLAAWSLVAWVGARSLIVSANLARADALVVLSGGASYPERTRRAAELFAEGRAPKIVLTNDGLLGPWSFEKERNPTFTELEAEALLGAGVPAESIEALPQQVSNTYDEALLLLDYARTRGLRSILVVTSAYHSRRALWVWRRVFRESGINVGIAHAPTGDESPPPATWWWHVRGWRSVAGEYPKFIYYWLRYF